MRKCFITAYICGLLGFYFGGQYNSDFSLTWYKEANTVKGDLLEEFFAKEEILENTLLSVESSDLGVYEDLIDDMADMGYFKHVAAIDSILDYEQ